MAQTNHYVFALAFALVQQTPTFLHLIWHWRSAQGFALDKVSHWRSTAAHVY
jgi:hypothetical protein